MTARHLALVGMMGSGKTAVGHACAERLGREWIDTDDLTVELAGRPFDEIWGEGEAHFRAWERLAVERAVSARAPVVVSCGGGVVLDAENRRALAERAVVVWLRARPETLAERVGDGAGRPLLAGGSLAALRELSTVRAETYRQAADFVIDTDDLDLDHVTTAVLAAARLGE